MRSLRSDLLKLLLVTAVVALPLACGDRETAPGAAVALELSRGAEPAEFSEGAGPSSVVPPGSGPLIVLTGNEKGFIRPCGCSKPALGGVHRRATALEKLRVAEPGLHLVSVGDLVIDGGRQQRMKFETFLMSMAMMGYEAMAPGTGEFALGVDYLLEMRTFGSFPFVGLNVSKDGEPVFKDHVRLGETDLLVTGLIASLPGIDEVQLTPPAKSLSTWLATRNPSEDRVVVLFNGSRAAATQLAAAIPEGWRTRLSIVFGGAFDGPFSLPKTQVPVVSVGSKGRFLAYLRPDEERPLSHYRLEESIAGQADVSAMLDGYRQSLKDEELVANFPRRPLENGYMGDASCVECHEDSCKVLDPTPHEHAWASLKATNDHHDPECVACHVTGWGDSSGFITEASTPKLINVTCEACHGPGEEHNNLQTKTPNGKLGKQFCVKCHDPDNSPKFDFDKYWPKIQHPPKAK